MKHVVMFSGGVASWAAARRVADEHGTADLTLLFTDTLTEDEDTYRFLDEAAADVGGTLVKIADGRTIWDVFRDERFLGNSRVDPCSRILKRDLSRKWLEANCDPSDTTVYLGFDWTEEHRYVRAAARWLPWSVEAPMLFPPYRLRAEMMADAEARGLRTQRLYRLGMDHANCGGGCVKAGQSHFAKLLDVFPARYAEWEANEQSLRDDLGNVSILRDRIGGDTGPLTLTALRERIEAGQSIPLWEIGGCACFEEPET